MNNRIFLVNIKVLQRSSYELLDKFSSIVSVGYWETPISKAIQEIVQYNNQLSGNIFEVGTVRKLYNNHKHVEYADVI